MLSFAQCPGVPSENLVRRIRRVAENRGMIVCYEKRRRPAVHLPMEVVSVA